MKKSAIITHRRFPAPRKHRKKFKISYGVVAVLSAALLFAGVFYSNTEPSDEASFSSDISVTETVGKYDGSTILSKEKTVSSENPQNKSSDSSAVSKATTQKNAEQDKAKPTAASSISDYTDKIFIRLNNNVPSFSADELKTEGYEKYGSLDSLGRATVAIASLGKETMPKEGMKRGDISRIKPTGWVQKQYDNVSGTWLYNRCHLIGWQLSAENANKSNLITGTRYLNTEGMLPFENMVADYIKETNNHVAYRVTPIFAGNDLLCKGVQIEAYSVEDNGNGISFNVFCYNVQPGIAINYGTGESSSEIKKEFSVPTTETTTETAIPSDLPTNNVSQTVYTTATGKRYHLTEYCPGLTNAKAIYESTLSEAQNKGLTPCAKCY